ncbi:MAG: hypothetical protein LAQ69_32010 [Acidobacteriia bacterium]|nr:hypothetical protein [Terriglobia bacterium]
MSIARFFVGLDLGQAHDPSALAVLERKELTGEWDAVMYAYRKMAAMQLRYLERIPLGTPYPEVVERVREVTRSGELSKQCYLMVDATGTGRPVVDLLRQADLDCCMLPAVITSGHTESYSDGYYHVPKRDLIVGLQILMQRGGLQIASKMAFGRALVEEMTAMRVTQTARGHEQFGAWREGEHDDLVLAVALALWGAKKVCPRGVSGDDGVWRWEGELAGGGSRTKTER